MDLICFEVEPGRVKLRPANSTREWMDATPGSFVYRCLPLTMANSHGWEMLCPFDFEIRWNGGDQREDIEIKSDIPMPALSSADYLAFLLGNKSEGSAESDGESSPPANMVESHFGSGILTFNPLVILRTAPGYNLWVTGPVNEFKDGTQPMTALVESDWIPFTFSMNWKVTRPDTTIHFRKGEPFCTFFPVKRGVVDECEPKLQALSHDPALEKSYWAAKVERNLSSSNTSDDRERFQNWYAKGVIPGAKKQPRETPPRPGSPKEFK